MKYPKVHRRTLFSLELAVKVATLADGTRTFRQIAETLGLTRGGVFTLITRTNNCYKQCDLKNDLPTTNKGEL